jgi:tripartite-type tricarboxylate transporter receptor subunit TctC
VAPAVERSTPAAKHAEMKNFILQQGADPAAINPQEPGAYIRSEIDKRAKVVKAIGLKVDREMRATCKSLAAWVSHHPPDHALKIMFKIKYLHMMPLTLAAAGASAQPYPVKAIRFLVPYAAGAGTDTTARTLAIKLTERWGQQVIVDNRGGASGALAVEATVNANPDGYTIVLITNSQAVGAASGIALPYQLARDLQPITQLLSVFYVIYIPPSLPAKSIQELIAHARANPGKLNYGSSGAGSLQHIGAELFNQMAGTRFVHVPYKGSAGIISGMLSNEIQLGMNSLFGVRPQVQAGRLRWLAITARKRSPVVDLPTVAEAGLPGFEVEQWYGIAAPLKIRAPVITALHTGFTESLQVPEVARRLTADGSALVGSTPAQFGELIKSEIAKWAKVIKAAGIKAE